MADGEIGRRRRTLGRMASTNAESRWTLNSTGNRVMWAVVAAFVAWLAFRGVVLPIAAGLVVFAILTAVAASRR